ncbi:uncharacterized protein LOC134096181 [Sardina pilchardus]|uniref:uncharacterized protein LOC134096181 n=1 Tax=Sardina pilchardus TaxID=27697 RepID=UPI002E0F4E27
MLHQGDSVVINCTIFSEMKTEDFRVSWFKVAEDDSHPGVIYTDMNRSRNCERGCSYRLARTNLSLTDTGTYYCAISTCGKILFGNGTVLNIREPVNPLVYGLSVAVGLCAILILIFIISKKSKCSKDQDMNVDMMNYAALNFSDTWTTRGRKKRELQQDTVYTGVNYSCFERLVLDHIKTCLPTSLDPLQFAYHQNRSTEDAISMALHSALSHLDNSNTCTKEVIVDFRKSKANTHISILINRTEVECVTNFKFLGVYISEDLSWTFNTSSLIKKAHQRLFFLKILKKVHLSLQILVDL